MQNHVNYAEGAQTRPAERVSTQNRMSANRKTVDENLLERLSDESGLAVIVVDENSSDLSQSNNNSMCRHLYDSAEFAPECAKFCGKAFGWATEAGKPVEYKCYAGLTCIAVPLAENAAAITGRAFLKADDYRAATERAVAGDWQKFPADEFFENVLLNSSAKNLETLAARIEKLSEAQKANLFEAEDETEIASADEVAKLVEQFQKSNGTIARRSVGETEELAAWRSLFGSLLNLSYEKAYQSILRFLGKRYSFDDLAWAEVSGRTGSITFQVAPKQLNSE